MDSITAELDFLHRCIEALKNENYSLIRENDSLRNENSNLKNLLEKAGIEIELDDLLKMY